MGVDGRANSPLGAPKSPEASARASARYATFDKGAIYWSPQSGAEPVTGAIYKAWASLGYERGALGLPTSGEIHEPLWIVQNFQHGTLNFDREKGTVTRVIDGVPIELPPPPGDGAADPARAVHPGHQPELGDGVRATSVRARGPGRRRCWARSPRRPPRPPRDARCPSPRRARPMQHRHVVGHIAERHDVLGGDAQRAAPPPRPRWPC